MEWQPINNAPDDEWVLVWCRNDDSCMIAMYTEGLWFDENGYTDLNPSHWMPLPEPPK